MNLSILQLNCENGRFFPELSKFLQKSNFDIVNLQEVAKGNLNKYNKNLDILEQLEDKLGYHYELTKTLASQDNKSYLGNATLFKSEFSLLFKNTVWLKPFTNYEYLPKDHFEDLPRNALHLQLIKDKQIINVINTHLAWGITPLDEFYKIEQANILTKYLKQVKHPFILTGDFNVKPDTIVVKNFDTLARNLISENKVTNTLNSHTHRATQLFPPGIPVDYIYITEEIKVNKFEVIEETLSDHLGLYLEADLE